MAVPRVRETMTTTVDDPGEYVLDDAPIATVDAETIGDLLAPYRDGDSA